MSSNHYRLLLAAAASLSLLTAGCSSSPSGSSGALTAAQQPTNSAATDYNATLWTVLGLAKKPPRNNTPGSQLGPDVSPSLWQASHDALSFVKLAGEDSESGVIQTEWYSPPGKPDERLRINVFILSIALRTTSLAVTIDRETRSTDGQWQKTTVDRQLVDNLENTILLRARHLHAEEYRSMM
ncbi:MAG: DUF3576 domain-containing protein [Stellaceae bacterium]